MRKPGSLILPVLIMLIAAACAAPVEKDAGGKIGVAVSILPQQEFVSRVGGDRVDITVMVPPGANPHSYEVTPVQMAQLSRAKIYFKVGSPIEFELSWLDKLIAANRDMAVIDCSNGVKMIKSTDPEEPGIDPHIWTSPHNAMAMVKNICQGLVQIDAENREYYEKNRDIYLAELEKLDVDLKQALTGMDNRTFIVYHPAWGYFARDYGLDQMGIEQEGKEPKPAYLARLIDEAKKQNIKVVFISPEFDSRNAEAIAREIGGRVVVIDPLAGNYLDNMRKVAVAFKEAF